MEDIRYPWNRPQFEGAKDWIELDYFKKLVRDLRYIPTIWEWAGFDEEDALRKKNLPMDQWKRFSWYLQVNGLP